MPVCRLAASVAAVVRVRRFMQNSFSAELLLDCIRSGARPNEAWIWRQFFCSTAPHPLPGRAAGRLLSQLGSASEHELLADKLATAELLAGAGLAVPRPLDPNLVAPEELFVKPRRGSGSRGAMPFLAYDGPLGPNVLVQERLRAAASLADLATDGAAPVLRLTTARRPGQGAFLHSALLTINVPGENPRHFIRGQVRAPIDTATGRMADGIWFLQPGERDSRLRGREIPAFGRAVEMVLQAMALLPNLALVNWDVIVTDSGPVILEGNTGGDWILTMLPAAAGIPTVPLEPLLQEWALLSDEERDSGENR